MVRAEHVAHARPLSRLQKTRMLTLVCTPAALAEPLLMQSRLQGDADDSDAQHMELEEQSAARRAGRDARADTADDIKQSRVRRETGNSVAGPGPKMEPIRKDTRRTRPRVGAGTSLLSARSVADVMRTFSENTLEEVRNRVRQRLVLTCAMWGAFR
jgi:hypothetical protein